MKIVLCGAVGRMGRAILEALCTENDLQLGGVIEIAPFGDFKDFKDEVSKGEVIIDFTAPDATLTFLQEAISQKKAMVIGTTGFSQEEKKKITVASKKIPIVLSPNMSVGVNVVFKLLADVASALGNQYDAEILEMHHKNKKDAPSGTALHMGEVIASARGTTLSNVGCFSRHGTIGVRPAGEIGIQSLRAGDVVGEHTVLFDGHGERIEISHRAYSRQNFAWGALIAARWIVNQKPGLYDMMDVLNLKK